MTKNVSRILALFLALVLALSLVGCSKSKSADASKSDRPEGTWRLVKVDGDDLETSLTKQAEAQGYTLDEMLELISAFAAMAGADINLTRETLRDYMLITLKEGGEAVVSSVGVEENGTWTQNGNTITLKVTKDGETSEMDLTLENGTLVMKDPDSGSTMVFTKD